jgi:excisionase family DNA binding protein
MFEANTNPGGGNDQPVSALVSPYLITPEAATYLRTTVQGIYALVKRGRLKPMPGSGRLLFTRQALDACLTRCRR